MNNNKSLNTNNSAAGKMVLFFFELQTGTKMYHWQTTSYANHKATDQLLGKLADLTDSFLEKYFGVFSRPTLRSGASIPVENMNKAKFVKLLKAASEYFRGPLEKLISKNSELMNIRDEMLAEIDQTKYLLTLDSSPMPPLPRSSPSTLAPENQPPWPASNRRPESPPSTRRPERPPAARRSPSSWLPRRRTRLSRTP
jgi:hypothetical protein